jgi:hypothetical protein
MPWKLAWRLEMFHDQVAAFLVRIVLHKSSHDGDASHTSSHDGAASYTWSVCITWAIKRLKEPIIGAMHPSCTWRSLPRRPLYTRHSCMWGTDYHNYSFLCNLTFLRATEKDPWLRPRNYAIWTDAVRLLPYIMNWTLTSSTAFEIRLRVFLYIFHRVEKEKNLILICSLMYLHVPFKWRRTLFLRRTCVTFLSIDIYHQMPEYRHC